ncbi:hypothetical protein [Candidatus Phycosocius bacilliformis]|nr:hypothetical protein [Candidatus Phycosocius bacilliformis]
MPQSGGVRAEAFDHTPPKLNKRGAMVHCIRGLQFTVARALPHTSITSV